MSTEGRRPTKAWEEPTIVRDALLGVLLGDYRVEERLGEGGMGIVYRGVQPVLSRGVAIKVLKPEFASDPKQLARLLEEARTVSAIRHPNIVDVFSFGHTQSGQPYFVMDLLEGQPLDLFIHENGVLSVKEALDLIEQVFSALSAAHDVNVVHRDLKPSNIFVQTLNDGSRFAKLLDFGLAKRMADAPAPTVRPSMHLIGTPEYMAPEQIRSEPMGASADLYAAGVTLYEMLTGRPPFLFDTAMETLMHALSDEPAAPSVHERSVPAPLDAFVLKLLSKQPAGRPPSAAAAKQSVARLKRELAQAETRVQQSSKHPAVAQSAKHAALVQSSKHAAHKDRPTDPSLSAEPAPTQPRVTSLTATDERPVQDVASHAETPRGGLDAGAARTSDSDPNTFSTMASKPSQSTFDDDAKKTSSSSASDSDSGVTSQRSLGFDPSATVSMHLAVSSPRPRRWPFVVVASVVAVLVTAAGLYEYVFTSAPVQPTVKHVDPPRPVAPAPKPSAEPRREALAQPEELPPPKPPAPPAVPTPAVHSAARPTQGAPKSPRLAPTAPTPESVAAKAKHLRSLLGSLDESKRRIADTAITEAETQEATTAMTALNDLEARFFQNP